jgi:membrane fusion protein (multidrug efflux system)
MLVDAEGKAAPRPVKVGAMAGSDWIVVDGLKGGEQIIVNGLQKARPGTPVKAVPAGAAPASAPGTPAASPAPAAGK